MSTLATKGAPIHLTDGLFAAADPQINFEGTKVLFSGQKKQGERWQIWEMEKGGSNKREITQCTEDCLRGASGITPFDSAGNSAQEFGIVKLNATSRPLSGQ